MQAASSNACKRLLRSRRGLKISDSCCWAPTVQQLIDISCTPGLQQQTRRTFHFILLQQSVITSSSNSQWAPGGVRSIAISVSVCLSVLFASASEATATWRFTNFVLYCIVLSVCLFALAYLKTTCPNFKKFSVRKLVFFCGATYQKSQSVLFVAVAQSTSIRYARIY